MKDFKLRKKKVTLVFILSVKYVYVNVNVRI